MINDLRKQLNSMQNAKNELIDTGSNYQKSAFMEEFEELMPSNELSDYINLQKEIKRLKEENFHVASENKELLGKLKYLKQFEEDTQASASHSQEYEMKFANFEQEIFVNYFC